MVNRIIVIGIIASIIIGTAIGVSYLDFEIINESETVQKNI